MNFRKSLHMLLLIAAGLAQIGIAQETTTDNLPQVYQVEIILFRFTNPESTSTETLRSSDATVSQTQSEMTANDPPAAIDDSLNGTTNGQIRRIPVMAEQQLLGDISRQLSASGTYKVLAYRGWLQLLDSEKNAAALPLTDLDIQANIASGQLQVYREQSVYLAPAIELTSSSSSKKPTIKGARQIPLGKPVYFDHPQFGLIAMITQSDSAWPAE